jgi:hypothetical protein
MHVDVLHSDLLLALAAKSFDCNLFAEHRAPVAFHGGIVGSEQLGRNLALDFVFRANPEERRYCGFILTIARLVVRMLDPKCLFGDVGSMSGSRFMSTRPLLGALGRLGIARPLNLALGLLCS